MSIGTTALAQRLWHLASAMIHHTYNRKGPKSLDPLETLVSGSKPRDPKNNLSRG